MTFTPGRYIISDTDAFGMPDMPALTSQVRTMRETFEAGIEKSPGLIIIAVDDSERKAAVRRVLNALGPQDDIRDLLFKAMVKLHQLPGVIHCGTRLEDEVIAALDLPPHNDVDYRSYWEERAKERGFYG